MNTDKLLEAIQILVQAEVKKQIPIIRKQILESIEKSNRKPIQEKKVSKQVPSLESLMADETEIHDEVQYVKDPVLNKVLNETKRSTSSYPGSSNSSFEEYPTMKASPIGTGIDRSSIAEKMGYGDFGGASKTGLGVKTGNEVLDKALNRDYTELVKRFK
jgi:hypothetical protein